MALIKNSLKMPINDTIMSLQYMTAFHYHTEAYRGHFLNQNRYERLTYDARLFASNILGSIPKEYIEKTILKTLYLASLRYY